MFTIRSTCSLEERPPAAKQAAASALSEVMSMTAIQPRTYTQAAEAAEMAITLGQPAPGAAARVRGFARALTSFEIGRAHV